MHSAPSQPYHSPSSDALAIDSPALVAIASQSSGVIDVSELSAGAATPDCASVAVADVPGSPSGANLLSPLSPSVRFAIDMLEGVPLHLPLISPLHAYMCVRYR